MTQASLPQSNFYHLHVFDEQLVRLGVLAEKYFSEDPNTCLIKVRQFAELLAQQVASHVGQYASPEESQYELLRRLQDHGILPREVAQIFGEIRRTGNAATHAIQGDHQTALTMLKMAWQLGIWFQRTFKDGAFKPGPFIPPISPQDQSLKHNTAWKTRTAPGEHHRGLNIICPKKNLKKKITCWNLLKNFGPQSPGSSARSPSFTIFTNYGWAIKPPSPFFWPRAGCLF